MEQGCVRSRAADVGAVTHAGPLPTPPRAFPRGCRPEKDGPWRYSNVHALAPRGPADGGIAAVPRRTTSAVVGLRRPRSRRLNLGSSAVPHVFLVVLHALPHEA